LEYYTRETADGCHDYSMIRTGEDTEYMVQQMGKVLD
jgi:hypothetical protein